MDELESDEEDVAPTKTKRKGKGKAKGKAKAQDQDQDQGKGEGSAELSRRQKESADRRILLQNLSKTVLKSIDLSFPEHPDLMMTIDETFEPVSPLVRFHFLEHFTKSGHT